MKAITESGKNITIDDKYEIKRGGEGKILIIPELPNQVAKIYLKLPTDFSQIKKRALEPLPPTLFVKPLELIYQAKAQQKIIGFTMELLDQDYFPLAALFMKSFCTQYHLDDNFLLNIAEKVIEGVQKAHQLNVVIGDLSGLNILVNTKGDVKFLDVDAYQTSAHTHTHILFDEIRDYLYQGKVSEKSDFFAASVLIFSLFTHLHPFKGVHKVIKTIAERMIKKIPVFANDKDLVIPKCYEPLQNTNLQQQFEKLYLEGERFLLQLQKNIVFTPTKTPTFVTNTIKTSLKTKEIYQLQKDEWIITTAFSQKLGFIQTNQKLLIYDASQQGYTTLKYTLLETNARYLVSEKYLYKVQNNHLLVFNAPNQWQKIENLLLDDEAKLHQIGNILIILQGEFIKYVHLDELIQNQIYVEQTPTFILSFDIFNGFIQNVGGMQYIFYHSGKNISTIKTPMKVERVHIVGNVGWAMIRKEKQNETSFRYEYFTIDGLQMNFTGQSIDTPKFFAFKPTHQQDGLIFEAIDDKLVIRRRKDGQILQESDCSLLNETTHLISTQAGIIAWNDDFCYLLNS